MSSIIRHEFIMKCPAFTKYQPNTRVKGGWERNDFDSQMSVLCNYVCQPYYSSACGLTLASLNTVP